MDDQPLAGRVVSLGSGATAATIAAFLLAELGARITTTTADQADLHDGDHAGGIALTGYGASGPFAGAPRPVPAVHAIGGAALAQYTFSPGPAYLVSPYASVAQALLAAIAYCGQQLSDAPSAPVSALQSLFAIQTGAYAYGEAQDAGRFSHTPRGQMPTYSANLAADDWLFIGASTRVFMIKVLQVLGLDDILSDPRTHDGPRAIIGTDVDRRLWQRIPALIRTRPRGEWLAKFERESIPAGPVLTLEEALAHPQIEAAGLAAPGTTAGKLTAPVRVTRRGAAPIRPHQAGPLPLSGLRVVELAGYIAGPYVGRLLRDMGAEVVKVEPVDGDPFRTLGYGFTAWNWGKTGLALNLRDSSDRARLLSLVGEADILVTNYRPDALERMGVGRETMFSANASLIHCTVSAFGESGPMAHLPGFDPVVQGFTGTMKRQGGAGEPVKPQMAATDYLTGMLGALGVVAARLAQRERGGGAVVQTSLLAASLLLNWDAYESLRAGVPYQIGGPDFKGPHPLNGLHQTRDGWLQTVADPTAPPTTDWQRILAAVRDMDTDAALSRMAGAGIAAVPCVDPLTLPDHPHMRANELFITIEQPGLGPVIVPAPVLGPTERISHAPAIGEHNALACEFAG